ncbi:MAG TPA: winged helix-turn-helix domain-containing protein [Solirubrobacterales bacterium]|jgi:DNA-binding transcriptional ArsR family regulator
MTAKLNDEAMFTPLLAHPIRCRALVILAAGESSPVEIGRELGLMASHVAYHVRLLHEAGLIEQTDEIQRRGSIEHRYQAFPVDHLLPGHYRESSPNQLARRAYNTLCIAVAEVNCALSSGQFEVDHRVGRFQIMVDEVARTEVSRLYEFLEGELHRIRTEASERLDRARTKGASITALGTYFESP